MQWTKYTILTVTITVSEEFFELTVGLRTAYKHSISNYITSGSKSRMLAS